MPAPYLELCRRIGDNIHQARVSRQVTLQSLSRMTGIGLKKLDRYELGNAAVHLQVLLSIAQALKVKIGMLLAE